VLNNNVVGREKTDALDLYKNALNVWWEAGCFLCWEIWKVWW